ncbi:hypothetical protein [Paenibacillus medicaginis]|uniref:Aspartyl-phosphate phosphatase Spo0E family protein n=1 Tax=Paenibacillus medicaginis TaxID=1470560 RepID=A0ABV5BV75_9BACL
MNKVKKTMQGLRNEYFELTGEYPSAAGYGLFSSKEDLMYLIRLEKELRR